MAEKKAYFTLEKEGFATLVEKRSEFLAYAKPLTTEAEPQNIQEHRSRTAPINHSFSERKQRERCHLEALQTYGNANDG